MSCQKGNTVRTRPQKHKNRSVFKNSLHDTSHKTKAINATPISDVCQRCKEIIEWKIKYKKYKPLTQPKKCVKCEQKTVKRAYHIMCDPCGKTLGVCSKCGQSKELIEASPTEQEPFQLDKGMKEILKTMPERRRRTFIRTMNKYLSNDENKEKKSKSEQKEDILNMLNQLKLNEDNNGDDDFLDEFLDDDDDDDGDISE